jgi:putative RNA 2'-phosphotransferase
MSAATDREPPGHDVQLSRTLSHALRHEPWRYELELDEEGWADIDQVLLALREQAGRWKDLDRAQLEAVIATATKQRHEIAGGRIRASYGHSLPGRLEGTPAEPPAALFHGTARRALDEIRRHGLVPMSRQFVHLSRTAEMALEVGSRRDPQPALLRVNARAAHSDGIAFYAGNAMVWLADAVPARYLTTG